ncbi:putative wall-associated receptor kinase, galacturonan-binding domain-containing protein [Helianthus annuus]|uniref:Wall-associated receptor kinase, galacturonan-binding domain-containing protein n=1 Tax=Helianthus annuus TaxID=4232 RepID=A0A9K3J5N2_HELAN|nr:putative wall-associated receptor kinase, galacturonan-binding domain-containing protein [Helianthus annuus]KAJ0580256.1 putative wall-associated receptor kinase, galacturonan-binding domain-containing protein [Helianthus annuus]KAJ0587734.1 putative wall-associated receptor kinase, galacturonan-binding domain-containing protein [Helianthus annuus]KAJ0596201.1 putative wall-associated receptor kinase, galacturonan-binding domain-containing protein [Helianthus annuus]KAJ0756854.1 putative wal
MLLVAAYISTQTETGLLKYRSLVDNQSEAMKTLVLIIMCAVVLMFPFTASIGTNPAPETFNIVNATNLAKPGCDSRCGDLIVPYPFGMGINKNCSIGTGFQIYCNTSFNPPKAFLRNGDYNHVVQISDSTLRTSNLLATVEYRIVSNYTNSPYTFSKVNKFTVLGCHDYAWLDSETKYKNVSTGCMTICSSVDDAIANECSGSGCCQSSIPKDISFYKTELRGLRDSNDSRPVVEVPSGSYAFVGEGDVFSFNGSADLRDPHLSDRIEATVPIVLEWAIGGNLSCAEAEAMDGFACVNSNSQCVNSTRESGGYRCICKQGYQGNPYLPPGCQGNN